MSYQYFSRNSEILPARQAVVPLSDIHYSYGFGVYETVRVSGGTAAFLAQHCARLLHSAAIIDLAHAFSAEFVSRSARELILKNGAASCNLKILLIGGGTPQDATLYILCLNPLFPDRKLYKDGAAAVTYQYERDFPHAKTLNMLPSYLAYRQAKAAGAYDALLVNRRNEITEGTRSNFLALRGRTLFSPPAADILPGVTRAHVLRVAHDHNFEIIEQAIPLAGLADYDSFCLTSTSSKIMPLRAIDDHLAGPPSPPLQELMQAFNRSLDQQS